MKINVNNIKYDPKDWMSYENNFIPYVLETREIYVGPLEEHFKF